MKEKEKIRFFGITEVFSEDTVHNMLKMALNDDFWEVII